jgi:hypothetical protein
MLSVEPGWGTLRELAYNPQHPVSGFRPGKSHYFFSERARNPYWIDPSILTGLIRQSLLD